MKKTILIICTFLHSLLTLSQIEDRSSQLSDYIESLMEDESSKLDYEELLENIESLEHLKLDLNKATKDDFSKIPNLTELDIHNIIKHRNTYGYFQTIYELKNIPNFNKEKIDLILPFVTIIFEEKDFGWNYELQNRKNILYQQYQQNIQTKKGYIPDSTGTTKYLGNSSRYYVKYQFQTPNKVFLNLLGEKDAGEKGLIDFLSISFQLKEIWKIKQMSIGDYKVSFGQGLVIGNSTLFGKSSNTLNTFVQNEGLKKNASCNESAFLRGIGCTFEHRNWNFTTFASHKKIDANLSDSRITSFKTDGYHRTINELSKKHNVRESVIGGNATYKRNNWQIGTTILWYHYSDSLSPADKMYNRFKLKEENQNINIGINYKLFFRRVSLFGEVATNGFKGIATINGMNIQPNSRIGLLAIQRMYRPEYQADFSNAFGENSRTENESGFYIGTQILPLKKVSLSIYADVFSFPWAKYNINYPSKGQDYLVQLQHNTSRNMNMQVRYKYKDYIEQMYTRQTLRYINHWKHKSIEMQSLAEANKISTADKETYGWVLSEDFQKNWAKARMSLNIHYAYFVAENYNNRFYIYERDILNTFSMPLLYGKGHRIDINYKWSTSHLFQIYLNYGVYIYTDGRESIGSSYEQVEGNINSMVKGLLKWQF